MRKRRCGLPRWWSSKATPWVNCNMKRIAPGFGRGHHVRTAVSMIDGRPLSNTVGSVLDPVMSLRRTVRVLPGGTVRIVFSTIVGDPRSGVGSRRQVQGPESV